MECEVLKLVGIIVYLVVCITWYYITDYTEHYNYDLSISLSILYIIYLTLFPKGGFRALLRQKLTDYYLMFFLMVEYRFQN